MSLCVCVYHKTGQLASSSRGAVVNFKLLSKWKIAIRCVFIPLAFTLLSFFFGLLFPALALCLSFTVWALPAYIECFSMLLIRFIHCLVIDFRGDVGIQRMKWKIHTAPNRIDRAKWENESKLKRTSKKRERKIERERALNYLQSLDKLKNT